MDEVLIKVIHYHTTFIFPTHLNQKNLQTLFFRVNGDPNAIYISLGPHNYQQSESK